MLIKAWYQENSTQSTQRIQSFTEAEYDLPSIKNKSKHFSVTLRQLRGLCVENKITIYLELIVKNRIFVQQSPLVR